MLRPERLDANRHFRRSRKSLDAGGFAIAAHGLAQAVVDGLRVQQRLDEGLAVADDSSSCWCSSIARHAASCTLFSRKSVTVRPCRAAACSISHQGGSEGSDLRVRSTAADIGQNYHLWLMCGLTFPRNSVLHLFVPSLAAPSLSTWLGVIVQSLREAIAAHSARHRICSPLLALVWSRLGRRVAQFDRLLARIRAGRYPAVLWAREPRLPEPRLPDAWVITPPRLPRVDGWLVWLVPEASVYGSQLQHMLADPEMKALLAASPQAGRILRPLCRMLGIDPSPEMLKPCQAAAPPDPQAGEPPSGDQTSGGCPQDLLPSGLLSTLSPPPSSSDVLRAVCVAPDPW
jgi:hypothetical protein